MMWSDVDYYLVNDYPMYRYPSRIALTGEIFPARHAGIKSTSAKLPRSATFMNSRLGKFHAIGTWLT